jgi:3-methylfumaryl-CoA hydratase
LIGVFSVAEVMERSELIQPGPAQGAAGLLGDRAVDLGTGDGLPLLSHWFYLLDWPLRSDLGPDGHPVNGIPRSPGPGMQRLFAGGQVQQYEPLRIGLVANRRTWLAGTQDKAGRSGRLTFATVRHDILQQDRVVISEAQKIVYRDRPQGEGAAHPASVTDGFAAAEDDWVVDIDPVLLFRFSALTCNSHRIHYDREYSRSAEGYASLLVHGPLQAYFMAEHARMKGYVRQRCRFEFRLREPLFEGQGMVVSTGRKDDVVHNTVSDRSGRVTATGVLYEGI